MIVFADSSALVSHYAPSETDALPLAGIVVVSGVARVEVPSALWRLARDGAIGPPLASAIVRQFEADWIGRPGIRPRYERIELTGELLARAAAITGTHLLRTLDAIQLACALAARDAEPECRTMVVLDARLRAAAATERFDILPV